MNDLIKLREQVDWKMLTPRGRGEILHEVVNGLKDAAKQIDAGWLTVGAYWHFVVSNKVYRHCGDHIKNANDFLREVDIGVKRSMLDHYARMWGMFSRYLVGRDVPIRKLLLISPVIDQENVSDTESWVGKAEVLPYEALKNEVRERQGRITTDTCAHPESANELWVRCSCCGKWLQKLPISQNVSLKENDNGAKKKN